MTLTRAELGDRLTRTGRDPDRLLRHAPEAAVRDLLEERPVTVGLSRTGGEVRASEPDEDPRDGLTIEGHWVVFDSLTEINSWEGTFTERVLPGATKKTLREGIPKMQFDHGHHPLLGSLPLGRWNEAREDDTGTWSKGRMRSNWLVLPFAESIREGDVDGMSFRFNVVREKWYDAQDNEIKDSREVFNLMFWGEDEDRLPLRRDLIEVKASEAGPVVWPAYRATDVSARSSDGGRVVLDLGALSTPEGRRGLGYAVATADAEMARADGLYPGTPRGEDPRTRWAPVGLAVLERMAAHTVAEVHNRTADTAHAVHVDDEPQTTGAAAAHSTREGEPGGTGQPAETHSRSGQDPALSSNPTDRRAEMRKRLRIATDVVLALPKPPL